MPDATVSGHRNPLLSVGLILGYIAVSIRGVVSYFDGGHELRWVALGLMLAFGAVYVWSNLVTTRRLLWNAHGYIALQTALVLGLQLLPPNFDFFAIFFFMLAVQAILYFSWKVGFGWIVVFTLVTAGTLISAYELSVGLPLILVYASGYFFFGAFAIGTAQAEAASLESQELLRQLQDAHEQLREYAARAEETAAAQERNRLALELHDSVTQAIFSMTLTADAARIQLDRDPKEVTAQLDRLQELARGALGEMRSLVQELRITSLKQEGLVPALRQHLESLKSRTGLTVELREEGQERLSSDLEEALFRVVQEALNNVSKHAQTDIANVLVRMEPGEVSLLIEDLGKGFDPSRVGSSTNNIGLAGMRERVEMQGGKFQIDSSPGNGTRVSVKVPQVKSETSNG